MPNYKITVQYDGTRFKGWQVLKDNDDTIQGRITQSIRKLTGENVELIGSGRTDAGVHALGQIANFHVEKDIDTEEFLTMINEILPDDIAIVNIVRVDGRFHARFSCVSKTYRYRIHYASIPDVFTKRFTYSYTKIPLDVTRMKAAASHMVGEKDFMSFCGNSHMKKSTVRTVTDINIQKTDKEIIIDYTGDGFLQGMVRIMTGTLIEVGIGRKCPEDIPGIIESRCRENAGYTAPSKGLCLLKVQYR